MTNMNESKNNTVTTPEAYLDKFVDGTMIFIDTCAMLEESFPLFVERVTPYLMKHDNRIVVPRSVLKELVKHACNPENPKLKESAVKAYNLVYTRPDIFRVEGKDSDGYADNLHLTLYLRYRVEHRTLFITQDKDLAVEILNNSKSNAVRAYAPLVKKITPQGYLYNLRLEQENGRWKAPDNPSVSVGNVFTKRPSKAFRICEQPTVVPDDAVSITKMPGEEDIVYAMNPRTGQFAEVKLGGMIASGGEGSVYETSTEFVAKIYKQDKVTVRRREKVMLMTKNPMEFDGICFPVAPLFNSRTEFVGYLMEKAEGEELQTSVFCAEPVFRKKHPDWKKEDLVQLCITILTKIEFLHSNNIIIGDLNPGNILVKSPTEVWFVDTDSYQIEDYPCPVGKPSYTAPEIQGKAFNSFLRTMGNENFAIATLLFQIMILGKLPYAHADGGSQIENIMEMNFPYTLGGPGNEHAPDGKWKFMWSHLSYEVKETFWNTFRKDGALNGEDKRPSAVEWKQRLTTYLGLLRCGKMAKQDPMSESIFPTRPKGKRGALWAVCRHCGERFPYYENESENKAKPPVYCPKCINEIVLTIECEDCKELFDIRVPEYDYYMDNKYELPKRCPTCRNRRKAESEKKRYGSLEFNRSLSGKPEVFVPMKPKAATDSKPASEPKPAAKPQLASEPKPAAKPQPVSEPKPAPKPQPVNVPNPEPNMPEVPEKRGIFGSLKRWLIGA